MTKPVKSVRAWAVVWSSEIFAVDLSKLVCESVIKNSYLSEELKIRRVIIRPLHQKRKKK